MFYQLTKPPDYYLDSYSPKAFNKAAFASLFLDAYYTFQMSIQDPEMSFSYVLSLVSSSADTEYAYMRTFIFELFVFNYQFLHQIILVASNYNNT